MKWTGERLITSVLTENTIEHLHRYAIALEYCKDKEILDIACGEGYGTQLLSKVAKRAIGMDISAEAIRHASSKYVNQNISFQVAEAHNIPLSDCSIDVVVSFETIEHHDKHEDMIKEIIRILRPDGLLILSSPDKKYYSQIRNYTNPFHVKELTKDELIELISKYFAHTEYIAQRSGFFSVALSENKVSGIKAYQGNFTTVEKVSPWGPMYWIVLASIRELPKVDFNTLFIGDEIVNNYKILAQGKVKKSYSYRVGYMLLRPFRILLRILNVKANS